MQAESDGEMRGDLGTYLIQLAGNEGGFGAREEKQHSRREQVAGNHKTGGGEIETETVKLLKRAGGLVRL